MTMAYIVMVYAIMADLAMTYAVNAYAVMASEVPAPVCLDMRVGVCTEMFIDICRHAHRHVHISVCRYLQTCV